MAAFMRKVLPVATRIINQRSNLLSRTCAQMTSHRNVTINNLPVHYRYRDQLQYSIYAAEPGLVKGTSLESARLAIIRKTKNKQIIMVNAHVPITKKALGSRMGKGKGKVDHHVANIKAGKIMFEYSSDSETLAVEAFRQASGRLPVKTHLRVKPSGKKEIWTKF